MRNKTTTVFYPWNHGITPDQLAELNKPSEINWHQMLVNAYAKLRVDHPTNKGVCYAACEVFSFAFWGNVLQKAVLAMQHYLSRCMLIQAGQIINPEINDDLTIFFQHMLLFYENQDAIDDACIDILGKKPQSVSDFKSKLQSLLAPVCLDNVGGEKRVSCLRFVDAYNMVELNDWLKLYEKKFGDIPFEIKLLSGNHACRLYYCPKTKKWILLDVNLNTFGLKIFKKNRTLSLANQLYNSLFGTLIKEEKIVGFYYEFFTAKKIHSKWH